MLNAILTVLCTVAGYLLGSISASVLLSKLIYKGDVRNYGSHNAGATNMARVYGLFGGLLVLLGDFLKAVIAMLIPVLLGVLIPDFTAGELAYVLAGAGCFLGHAYPIFFGFKGGKGVTVGAAVALMTDWKAFLIIISVFVIVFIITHIVSISSISAAAAFIVTGVLFYVFNVHSYSIFFGSQPFTLYKMCLAIFAGALVIFLHRSNIGRLIRKEEKKFTFKKRAEVKEELKERKESKENQ